MVRVSTDPTDALSGSLAWWAGSREPQEDLHRGIRDRSCDLGCLEVTCHIVLVLQDTTKGAGQSTRLHEGKFSPIIVSLMVRHLTL